jgi:hypothetical protein
VQGFSLAGVITANVKVCATQDSSRKKKRKKDDTAPWMEEKEVVRNMEVGGIEGHMR